MIIEKQQIEAILQDLEDKKIYMDKKAAAADQQNEIPGSFVGVAVYSYCINQLKGLIQDGQDQLSGESQKGL